MFNDMKHRAASLRQQSYLYHRLRDSASTVLTATGQVNGRWWILTQCSIETPELIATKFGTVDDVCKRTD